MADDPYKYFRVEAREIVEQLGKDVLDLEKEPPARDRVARLFRLAHTLKGAARVVKQPEIAELAHAMEDAMAPLREGGVAASRALVEGLLRIVDAMGARVSALGGPPGPAVLDATAAAAAPAHVDSFRALRVDLGEMDALLDGVAEVGVELAAVRRRAASVQAARRLADLAAEQMAAPRTAMTNGHGDAARPLRATLDELRASLATLERELLVGVDRTDRELRQVREIGEHLRLVPAALMFNALERAARDAAASLGKRVAFEAKGGDVRLDADVIAAIQSALLHAVRNAVAHGIEAPAQRAASGKPAEGRVALEVRRRGGRVAFVCRDDGRGVDVAAVERAARRAGKLANVGATKDQLLRMLLAGGISTAPSVTEVAGRGVGLDVVRETAQRLGGEVALRSEPGRGAELEVVVQASLTSLDALLVAAHDQVAAVPLDSVRATLRVPRAGVTRTADGESIAWNDAVIPFAPLARLLRVSENGGAAASATRPWSVMVIEAGGALAAIGVDRLVGTENVLLRPLPVALHPVVGGVSLDAEGDPRPVLDPATLVAQARSTAPAARHEPAPAPAILVIDDSLTTRMLEQSILESAGYEVDVAASGEEGLVKAHRRRYSLFLVDVEMPGMDGFTFVERSRADPALRVVPAILVTSRASPEDRSRGASAGAVAYIVKSEFDQRDLLARIGQAVSGP